MLFSIRVSELTPEMLAKAEWWKFYYILEGDGIQWADVRHRSGLDAHQPVSCGDEVYGENVHCFPVSLSPNGTETRLECPRMPDEREIKELRGVQVTHKPITDTLGAWAFCAALLEEDVQDIVVFAPTPKHSPRLTLEGMWVWSTRK